MCVFFFFLFFFFFFFFVCVFSLFLCFFFFFVCFVFVFDFRFIVSCFSVFEMRSNIKFIMSKCFSNFRIDFGYLRFEFRNGISEYMYKQINACMPNFSILVFFFFVFSFFLCLRLGQTASSEYKLAYILFELTSNI